MVVNKNIERTREKKHDASRSFPSVGDVKYQSVKSNAHFVQLQFAIFFSIFIAFIKSTEILG